MPLITVTAGRYSATYTAPVGASGGGSGALDMGITNNNGYELSWTSHQQEVRGTDAYGDSLLETVFRGGDFRLRMLFMEYKISNMNAAWPWGKAGANALSPVLGVVARLGSGVAGAMVLAATAGTPAASNPATLTASSVIVQPNANHNLGFTSRVREVPVEMVLLPYSSGGSELWFTVT